MSDLSAPVAIVGAGVSGLACAIHLAEAGVTVRVFEASGDLRLASESCAESIIER